jgi:hypothetical protein
MTRHPTDHLDNRRGSAALRRVGLAEVGWLMQRRYMRAAWKRPETADEVIACNKIDNDLQRVVLAHELNRLEKRNGF